jgi:hypothetical protein
MCSPSPPSGPSGAPSLLFRRMGRLPLQSARRVYKGPWHAWVGMCVVGTEVVAGRYIGLKMILLALGYPICYIGSGRLGPSPHVDEVSRLIPKEGSPAGDGGQ